MQPKFCRNCGSRLNPDARFCESCGYALERPPNTPTPLPESSASISDTESTPHVPSTLPESSASIQVHAGGADQAAPVRSSRGLLIAGILLGGLLLVGIGFLLFGLLNLKTPQTIQYAVVSPLVSATHAPVPTSIAEQNALPMSETLVPIAPLATTFSTVLAPTELPLLPTDTLTSATVTATSRLAVTRSPRPTLPNGMLFEDTFESPDLVQENGWTVGDAETWNHAWAPNQYILTSKAKGVIAFDAPQPEFENAGIQVEGQLASADYAQYGIALHVTESVQGLSGCFYGITADGSYFLAQTVNGAWIEPLLVPYTQSAEIKTGNTKNRLAALVAGNTIRLYINGTLVRFIADTSITGKGHAGVFVYSGNHDRAQAAFNRISILSAEKADSLWAPLVELATMSPAPTEIAVQPTPVPQTATRRPSTPKPSPTLSLYGNSLFADGFTGNYAGWNEGTDAQAQKYFQDGQYHMLITAPKVSVLAAPGMPLQPNDFVMETQVTAVDGPQENAAGVFFRQQNANSFYIFRVSPNGGFAFARYRDGKYEQITTDEWIYTSAIHGGYASNLLRVKGRGDTFTFFINDVKVGTFRDSAYATGSLGLAASVWGNTGSHFTFDNFRVWDNATGLTASPQTQPQPSNTIKVFFTIQNGSPGGYVIDKQGMRHDGSVQAAISGIALAAGDRIVLQTDAPRFSLMFDCSTEPQAFTPCDFTADAPANLPTEIRVNKNGALGFINLSRADNWGDLRPGHAPQRYPADPVLRIVLGH